eukprot:1175641-Prorocentrum_minimum.AAC.3
MQAAEQNGNGTGHDSEPKLIKHSSNKSKKSVSRASKSKAVLQRVDKRPKVGKVLARDLQN